VYAFGAERKADCEELLRKAAAAAAAGRARVFLPRLVVAEVGRNMPAVLLKECHLFWNSIGCVIDEDDAVPSALMAAYLNCGLKPADALIGAYAEWVGADFLISENRDFLALTSPLPFTVMKASAFLKTSTLPPKT